MPTKKQRIIGWIRAMRLHFLFAYVVLGLGGIFIGLAQFKILNSIPYALLSFAIIIIMCIGINYRDEAADWIDGYDAEIGGTGVIREGILEARPLQVSGRLLNTIAGGLAIIQIYFEPQLIYLAIPVAIMIIGSNYLTEKVTLGHELMPAFSFAATFLWVYLAQGWRLTQGTLLFFIFSFIIIFALVPYQDVGDYEADKKTGKKTLTVKLGIDKVGLFSIFIALVSLLFLYFAIYALLNP
ncbi:MAG TPA: UbiA family prenyltransferase [Candidatus Lokiarchaeia archaeon]|nr:UbiA family prenyltransferase [Candidatus Lokiarchaeia archaeon]